MTLTLYLNLPIIRTTPAGSYVIIFDIERYSLVMERENVKTKRDCRYYVYSNLNYNRRIKNKV